MHKNFFFNWEILGIIMIKNKLIILFKTSNFIQKIMKCRRPLNVEPPPTSS